MKHEYVIDINNGCRMKEPFLYNFSNTKNIELHLKKNNASIRVYMNAEKTHEDIINFRVSALKDAYRKIFLLHGVLYDQNIAARKVTVWIDGCSETYDRNTEGFPFIWSMISKKPMHLQESWRTKDFCNCLISPVRSNSDADRSMIAVLAYLSSKGREYEVDRFSNLWTSMNAFYQSVSDQYNNAMRQKYCCTKEQLKKIPADVRNLNFRDLLLLIDTDLDCMSMVMECIDPGNKKLTGAHFKGVDNTEQRRYRYQFENAISNLPVEKLSDLYEYAWMLLKAPTEVENSEFQGLAELSEKMGQKLFFFLVFEYPYYCRCIYLHGEKALLLLAYENEYAVKNLRAASYFVERYLAENIPALLEGKWRIPEEVMAERESKITGNANKWSKLEKYLIQADKYLKANL